MADKIRHWVENQEDHDVVLDAATSDFVKVTVYSGSRVGAWVKIEVVFVEETKKHVFTLRSKILKKKLVEYLQSVCESKDDPLDGLKALCDEMTRNLFVPCMSEIRALNNMIRKRNDDDKDGKCTITADKASGSIKLTLRKEKYKVHVVTNIPKNYPEDALVFELSSKTYPYSVIYRYTNIANDISRRCALGWPAKTALMNAIGQGQGPEGLDEKKNKKKGNNETSSTIKATDIHKFKHDMLFLKKTKELRKINSSIKKGTKDYAESTSTRRYARKQLKKLNREEVAVERRLIQQQEREAALCEAKLKGLEIGDVPTSSLRVVLEYLIDSFAMKLPIVNCSLCGERLLPSDPNDLMMLFREGTADEQLLRKKKSNKNKKKKKKEKKGRKPVRLYCGDWFHYSCLDTALTSPPFKKPCPVCSKRMYHKAWPSDVKKLEKRWANEQAKKREVGEIGLLLGFGVNDEFARTDQDNDPLHDRGSAYDRMF
jgi:hypothetical protein